MHGGAGLILLDSGAFMIGENGIGSKPIAYGFSEYHVEPAGDPGRECDLYRARAVAGGCAVRSSLSPFFTARGLG